jgi:hypothetical protein
VCRLDGALHFFGPGHIDLGQELASGWVNRCECATAEGVGMGPINNSSFDAAVVASSSWAMISQ